LLTQSAALFGQVTYDVTDRLHLTGGLRYTWEQKELDAATSATYWNAGGIANAGKQDETWGHVSWKGVAAYDLGESTMTYASVTSGFKSGGWSSDDFGVVD